ncbi:hypothetical protein LJC56_04520 [Christensenellaceae bacterium OttesenSCG-928-K19]|nr:hypothetical protein [Christensenellaceae bacterium OttesenSCG-928-K19]
MQKERVCVSAIIAEEEYVFPVAVALEGGCMFDIERILSVQAGQNATCYTVSLRGLKRNLYHEQGGGWFLQ